MKIDELTVKFEADTECIEMLLNDLEVLSERFPAAVAWLFDTPGKFEGMLEIKSVEAKPGEFHAEVQPSDILLGYVHALKIAHEQGAPR